MVSQNTVHTYGVNQAFRFVEGISLHRKSRQIQFFSEKIYFTSYVRNMIWAAILYKYHKVTILESFKSKVTRCVVAKKCCPFSYSKSQYENVQDFLGIQYWVTRHDIENDDLGNS